MPPRRTVLARGHPHERTLRGNDSGNLHVSNAPPRTKSGLRVVSHLLFDELLGIFMKRRLSPVVLSAVEFDGDPGRSVPAVDFKSTASVAKCEPARAGVVPEIIVVDDQVQNAFHEPFTAQADLIPNLLQLIDDDSFDVGGHPWNDEW